VSTPLLPRFYDALARGDWAETAACYRDDARFGDPVFPDLDAREVRAMWKMLLTTGRRLDITYRIVEETASRGACSWEAVYAFSRTERQVHNLIHSEFELREGGIFRQRDTFDFWRWSRQALGPLGVALGWSPFVKVRVQRIGRAALDLSMTRP
jgi:ketosteroid isomerase-like protein